MRLFLLNDLSQRRLVVQQSTLRFTDVAVTFGTGRHCIQVFW